MTTTNFDTTHGPLLTVSGGDSLALLAPTVPAAQGGGLGWDHLSDPMRPVIVQVFYPNMADGELVRLYWNEVPIQTHPVVEAGSPMAFEMFPDNISNGDTQIRYEVIDPIGEGVTPSASMSLVVKRSLPGGFDPDPSDNINRNLAAPTGIPPLVTPELAAPGIPVNIAAYQNMTTGDTIRLSWHGYMPLVRHTVLAEEVNKVVTIMVPKAVILAAGDTAALVVRYEIRDVANNWSRWSPAATGEVAIDPNALAPPRVEEAIEGAIDLESLNGKDVTVRIPLYADMRKDDLIQLTWTGHTAADSPVPPVVVTHTVTESDLEFGIPLLPIPYAAVASIAQGQAAVHYTVTRNEEADQTSRRVVVRIVGQAQMLAPPQVLEAIGDELDPLLVPASGATVEIAAYPGMAAGDTVRLNWLGRGADNTLYPHSETKLIFGNDVDKPVQFSVPKSRVDQLADGSLTVSYTVTTFMKAEITSPDLVLSVKTGQVSLPLPSVDGAVDGELDPEDVPTGTQLRVPASANTQAGDIVRVYWKGKSDSDGIDSFTNFLPINAGSAGQPLAFLVARQFITNNIDAEVTVSYQIERGDDILHSHPLNLHVKAANASLFRIHGSRSLRGAYYYSNLSRLVVAPADSDEVLWTYEGETEGVTSNSFLDTQPERALSVSISMESGKQIYVLRPGNITGIFSLKGHQSGCIVKDDGTLFGWSDNSNMRPPDNLTDIHYVVGGGQAYAAIKRDGTVVAWGEASFGGTIPPDIIPQLFNVKRINASGGAFAALRADGRIITWGDAEHGGTIPVAIAPLLNQVIHVMGSTSAFTAVLANGNVFSWGGEENEGIPVPEAQGATQISASNEAFAALKADGSVVAWGSADHGGVIPTEIAKALTGVILIASSSAAFTALKNDGSVVAWGSSRFGGDVPADLSSVQHIVGSTTAFAALKNDDTVRAWGEPEEGGVVPPALPPVLSLSASYGSFCVVLDNRTALSWGINSGSPDQTPVACVCSAGSGLVLVTEQKTLHAWGNSSVPDLAHLDGEVSYINDR